MNAVRQPFTPEEFLEWRLGRRGRWELVNGHPVQMMAGAKRRHDRIVVNLLAALATRLKGGPCEPCSADTAVRVSESSVRQPDVTIDCGRAPDDALEAATPTVVFEVLSPSNRLLDQVRKLEEYKRVASLRAIVYVELDRAHIGLWTRSGADAAWEAADIAGLDTDLPLAAVGATLPLAEIYAGLAFNAPDEPQA